MNIHYQIEDGEIVCGPFHIRRALILKWRVPSKIRLIGTFSWCKNAMYLNDLSINDALSKILKYNPAGRLWFKQRGSGY